MFESFKFSQEEREEFLLFTVIVAGKNANFASNALKKFLELEESGSPFEKILKMSENNCLLENLKTAKTGNYHKIYNCFKSLVKTEFSKDLSSVSTEELETIKGIGPKTSRYFILHTIKNSNIAVLDTHILKWLKSLGYSVPNSTPQTKSKYLKIEKLFLDEAKKRKKSPYELDLEIWTLYSNSKIPVYHIDEKKKIEENSKS